MSYLGIEPDGARALADRLAEAANAADDLARAVDRALLSSGLDSAAATTMRRLAAALDATGAVLRKRAESAQSFVLDLALRAALVEVTSVLALDAAPCAMGPSTVLGTASPCDPVESVKVYSLGAGGFVPLWGVAGAKFDGSYLLRVEYLHSGRLRVTRIDEAALGVAWSVGQDSDVSTGPLTTMSGASAKAWVQLLLAHGTTFELARSDLDEFLVADVLDHLERALPLPGLPGIGLVEGMAKRFVGFADGLPLGKAHGLVSALRKRLNWSRPPPLSTFVEVGATAGTNAGAGLPLLAKIPIRGKTGIAVAGRAVVGIEHRPGGGPSPTGGARPAETTYYLDLRAEIGTPLAVRLLGIDLSQLRAVETKIGLVRGASGAFERLEFTIVTDGGTAIERHTAVIDLTDPVTQPAAQRMVDVLTDPGRLPEAIDALEALLGHQVTTEHSTMRRVARSTHGIEAMGSGIRFTVDELDVR
jgi:hypothetical protein